MKVIIVEDEGITRQWIKKKIEELNMGFQVDGIFSNGCQALEYLKDNEIDVVITDIQMPVMDGLELLEQIQKMKNQPYKVILSAYDEFCYARRAMKLGAQEFVLKPEITEENLQQILEEARKFQNQKNLKKQKKYNSIIEPEAFLQQLADQSGSQNDEELMGLLAQQGIFLTSAKIIMANIFFEGKVQKSLVLELLNLFLEQEQAGGVALACNQQEFVMLYSCEDYEAGVGKMQRLRETLTNHIGAEVYMGVSSRRQQAGLGELYRQALLASENRRFFSVPDCQAYENMRIMTGGKSMKFCFFQEVKQITSDLGQKRYREAEAAVKQLLKEIKESSYLYPDYVRTICNEFLAAYLQELWKYDLTAEEKEKIKIMEGLFEQAAANFKILEKEVARVVEPVTRFLEDKAKVSGYSTPVQKIVNYVEDHYGERISLAQISEFIYLSQSYVSTLFKKETGKKFSNYLQEVRIKKSSEMLLDTRLSIQEIAVRSGFFDTAHFSHVFKEYYGLSPLEYRKAKNSTKT